MANNSYLKPSNFSGTLILAIICRQGFCDLHFSDFTENLLVKFCIYPYKILTRIKFSSHKASR